jgi:hypothetical protein
MPVLLNHGPEGVRRWIDEFRNRLSDPVLHSMLAPAGVHVDRPAAEFIVRLGRGAAPRDDLEQRALFDIARAGVRLSQVVTSPWYFAFVRDIGRRARWAARWQASRRPLATGEDDQARADFAILEARMFGTSETFSVHDILETHAIVEGLQASMARPTAADLYVLAREYYRERPASLQLLSRLASLFDIETAVALAPRLCTAALRLPFPAIALGDLLRSLEKHRSKVDQLMRMNASQFFSTCGLNPGRTARSAREQAADAPFLEADPWDDVLRTYFDRYESLADEEARLVAAIHPMRPPHAPSGPGGVSLFQPAWLMFSDGQIADLRPQPGTLSDHARWVADALTLLDGLAGLRRTAPPGRGAQGRP